MSEVKAKVVGSRPNGIVCVIANKTKAFMVPKAFQSLLLDEGSAEPVGFYFHFLCQWYRLDHQWYLNDSVLIP